METLDTLLSEKGDTIYSVGPEASVVEAVVTMCDARIGAVLVMQDEALVGVFSERDLMRRVIMAGRDPKAVLVSDVMTADVICARADLTPEQAMEIMTRERIRHLPVLREQRLAGVVSVGDLVAWTIREKERSLDQLTEYVSGRYPG